MVPKIQIINSACVQIITPFGVNRRRRSLLDGQSKMTSLLDEIFSQAANLVLVLPFFANSHVWSRFYDC